LTANLHKIPAGENVPDLLNAIIQVPRGRRLQFVYDAGLGAFRLRGALDPGHAYPADFGFIPSTVAEDGHPLDVLVLTEEPTFTGCIVTCRPIGVLRLTDGVRPDYKVLAVPVTNRVYDAMRDLKDVPNEVLESISAFFVAHPTLSDGHKQEVRDWADADQARDVIFRAWEGFLL